MTSVSHLRRFNGRGVHVFEQIFTGRVAESALDPMDPAFPTAVAGTGTLDLSPAASAKEVAQRVITALGANKIGEVIGDRGLWAWLTFVLRDIVYPADASGSRNLGEVHRWLPSEPGDYQKGQRHLVRMPVLLLSTLGSAADHLLCGAPHQLPEIREQLTSQQDMFSPEFQKAARQLYFDGAMGKLKRGAGGKAGGSPRRLAKVRQQLDITWDLFSVDALRILELLPKEFEKFRAN